MHSRALAGAAESLGPLARCRVPLPVDYLEGLDAQRHVMESKHPVYLDGVWSETGFKSYFLMTLWYKVPHATQVLALLTGFYVLFRRRGERRRWALQAVFLLPAVVLLVVAGGSAMQLGIRYVLPLFPFLYIAIGQVTCWRALQRQKLRLTLMVACTLIVLAPLRFHPHQIAYFNELAGGPANGYRHLLDSNLDWGQDLNALAHYLDENRIDRVGLAYFGTFPPAALGIAFELPPAFVLQPGWYAVSENFVRGRPHIVRRPDGSFAPVDFGQYAYFQKLKPVARVGYSIEVYHLPER